MSKTTKEDWEQYYRLFDDETAEEKAEIDFQSQEEKERDNELL